MKYTVQVPVFVFGKITSYFINENVFFFQAYYIVGDMFDKMENVFECILDSEDRPPLKL